MANSLRVWPGDEGLVGQSTKANSQSVTLASDADPIALGAGSAIVGKVGIDQTTPGTTNGVQVNAALPAGTNTIGATKDAGPSWTPIQVATNSADMTTAADLTTAPTAGQKVVANDITVSTDTAMDFQLLEEGTPDVQIYPPLYMGANSTVQITLSDGLRVPTADKKLKGKASLAGNVSVFVSWHSEA